MDQVIITAALTGRPGLCQSPGLGGTGGPGNAELEALVGPENIL